MTDKSAAAVPYWMLIVCWIVALPNLIDGEYWWWLKALLFVPFILMTISLVHRRLTAFG